MPTSDSLSVTPQLSVYVGIFAGHAIAMFAIAYLLINGGR